MQLNMTKTFWWGIFFLFFLNLVSAANQTPTDIELQKSLETFKHTDGHIFFPEEYNRFQSLLTSVPATDKRSLKKIKTRLKQLIKLSKQLKRDLNSVLEARQQALEAYAPEFAEDEFNEAENALHQFSRRVASGYRYDTNDIQDLVRNYETAFRIAIRTNYLDQALILIQECKDLGSEKYFPQWTQMAIQKADQIETLINRPRIDMEFLSSQSEQLQATVHHLLWLTQLLHRFYSQKGQAEIYFKTLENKLDSLGTILGSVPDFKTNYTEILHHFIQRSQQIQDSLQNLVATVKNQQKQLDSLHQENMKLMKIQKTQQYVETKVRALRTEVHKNGGTLITSENGIYIRFSNIHYGPGKIEIPPSAVSKINTFLEAILAFPQQSYTVQVRLPQQGNPAYLQNLALQRANYIKGYLQAQVPLQTNQISTQGLVEPRLSAPVVEFFFHLNQ